MRHDTSIDPKDACIGVEFYQNANTMGHLEFGSPTPPTTPLLTITAIICTAKHIGNPPRSYL
jgi:hypothetical protein